MTTIKELEKLYDEIHFLGNDNLESQVTELYTQIKEQEAKLTKLKDNLKFQVYNSELKDKFLVKRELTKFSTKNIEHLPFEFLKLDETAIGKVYKSIVGGKKFLKQFKLEVNTSTSYSFNPKIGKEGA